MTTKTSKIEMEFIVNTYEIDLAGHVNNIVYVKWLEDLRNKLFNENFNFRKIIAEKCYPVVVSTNIKYKKQVKIFDKPVGVMEFCGYNHGIISLNAKIKLEDMIAATAEQKCVIINLEDSKMITKNKFYEFGNLV